jgi:hypothetical protein
MKLTKFDEIDKIPQILTKFIKFSAKFDNFVKIQQRSIKNWLDSDSSCSNTENFTCKTRLSRFKEDVSYIENQLHIKPNQNLSNSG